MWQKMGEANSPKKRKLKHVIEKMHFFTAQEIKDFFFFFKRLSIFWSLILKTNLENMQLNADKFHVLMSYLTEKQFGQSSSVFRIRNVNGSFYICKLFSSSRTINLPCIKKSILFLKIYVLMSLWMWSLTRV